MPLSNGLELHPGTSSGRFERTSDNLAQSEPKVSCPMSRPALHEHAHQTHRLFLLCLQITKLTTMMTFDLLVMLPNDTNGRKLHFYLWRTLRNE